MNTTKRSLVDHSSSKPSHLAVVGLVLVALLILVGRPLTNADYAQASSDDMRYTNSESNHQSWSIAQHLSLQKSKITKRLDAQFSGWTFDAPVLTWPTIELPSKPSLEVSRTKKDFGKLKTRLDRIFCDEVFVVDANKARNSDVIKRALEKCLINPSHTHKTNPQDYLTAATMRIIAQRAWFDVNMEYADDTIVSSSELFRFLNDLQTQTNFGVIPIVSHQNLITREEFLTILYKLFDSANLESNSNNYSDTSVVITKHEDHDVSSKLQHNIARYAEEHWNISRDDTDAALVNSRSSQETQRVGVDYEAVHDTWKVFQRWIAQL